MNKGILYIVIASFFFSIINLLVKYLDQIPAIEIVFFRSIVSLAITGLALYKKKIKPWNKYTPLLIGRGLAGAIALTLYFSAIQNMPLATAVTILYLAPIFTIIIAIFLLKEFPNKTQWPFLIIGFIGTALVKNTDPRVELKYFLMALTAAIFAALAYNFIRMLKGKADHNLVIFYFPLITIPFCLPFMIPIWKTPDTINFFLLLAIGVCTQVAQVFMTKAYMLEKASKISHYNYLTTFWAFISGLIFFDEHLNYMSIIGLFVIFIGIYFTARYSDK